MSAHLEYVHGYQDRSDASRVGGHHGAELATRCSERCRHGSRHAGLRHPQPPGMSDAILSIYQVLPCCHGCSSRCWGIGRAVVVLSDLMKCMGMKWRLVRMLSPPVKVILLCPRDNDILTALRCTGAAARHASHSIAPGRSRHYTASHASSQRGAGGRSRRRARGSHADVR